MTGLSGKVALVTGVGRGTARAHCERASPQREPTSSPSTSPPASPTSRTPPKRCAVADLGRLDVIVANAGIHAAGAPTWKLEAHE